MTPIPTVIEDVNVRVLESFPPQLDIHVTGYHPDSCDFPVQIDTRVNGNTITVEIYREVPPNVRCGEPTVPYETNFNLGSFDPGDYIIDVNGTIIEITL
jgi:inhibitor of cysteine peptidase